MPHFQPIVDMRDGRVFGYEVLGRSRLFGLKDPGSMFAAAKVLNMEGELSRILREEGIRHGQVLADEHILFVNTHPAEMDDIDLLVYSLHESRAVKSQNGAGNSRSGSDQLLRHASTLCGADGSEDRVGLRRLRGRSVWLVEAGRGFAPTI